MLLTARLALFLVLLPLHAHANPHLWSKRFGDSGPQQGWSVATDAAGNVFLAGQFESTINLGGGVLSSVGGADIFLAKFDPSGHHLWSQNFTDPNYDNTPSIVVDASGNVIMSGSFTEAIDFGGGPLSAPGASNVNVFVVKFDTDGHHLWSRSYGDAGGQLNFALAVDTGENVVLTGPFGSSIDFGGGPLTSSSVYDMYLVKLDANGNHVWSHSYGQTGIELSTHIAIDTSDNIVVAGRFNGSVNFGGDLLASAGGDDVYVVKFNSSRSHLWSHRFGDANLQQVGGLAIDASEDVVLTGSFLGAVDFGGGPLMSAGSYDAFLAKLESDGDHVWSYRFGDTNVQAPHAAAVAASGDIVITGSFLGTVDFGGEELTAAGSTSSDIFLATFGPGGNHVESARFGDASLDYASTVVFDPSNNIIVSGRFQGTLNFGGDPLVGAGDDDAFLAKFGATATSIGQSAHLRLELRSYPNPFNPSTTIVYTIPSAGVATLRIYHVDGRLVRTLVNGTRSQGDHTETWDGRDEAGKSVASGVYFARLAFEGSLRTQKVVLLK